MNIIYYKKKIKYYIFSLLKNISGLYIYQLIDKYNLFLNYKNNLDKGLLGRLIENYIVNKKFKGYICDINYLNWELKTVSLNNYNVPYNEVLLLTFKLFNFFKLNFKKKFFLKIHKILWVPLLGKKNIFFLYKIIGNFFLTYLDKKNIIKLWIELKKIINFLLNKNIILNNYYSKNFRLQFFLIKKNNNFLDFCNYYIRLYLNKNLLKKIFLNFKKYF